MRRAVAACLLLAAPAAALPAGPAAALPADRLDALVAGRVAGEPVACIDRLDIDAVRLVSGVGFVFEMRTGGVVYLNRVTSAKGFVHDGITPLIAPAAPRLCRGEPVKLLNENSAAPVATAELGDFTPYRRP